MPISEFASSRVSSTGTGRIANASSRQVAAAALSPGPHLVIRHPDLQLFFWRHMGGEEEVPWSTLWPHLQTFLERAPRLSERVGDARAALALLQQTPEALRVAQAAVHRLGYANYVTSTELDMALGGPQVGGGGGGRQWRAGYCRPFMLTGQHPPFESMWVTCL